MPKKTRKMKQRASLRRGLAPEAGIEEGESAAEPMTTMRFETNRAFTPLSYDYSHIYADLKRIVLFAGFFFVVLVVLSFVIK
ncbi:MAG: hypothetical protein HY868_22990 [Chloroflexi bacterium]|nr:hypothetical protein [Chloroflexota bacterium]